MKYKILYIEDQPADSIKDNLERAGFIVDVNSADDINSVISVLGGDYDAYIMDFRLTSQKGVVDAPTFASTLRTNGKNHKKKPIILISTEPNLREFENDFTSQDLFDFVVGKKAFRADSDKYSARIKSMIEAYKTIELTSYDIYKTLEIENSIIIDYRLIEKLDIAKSHEDTYNFCRIIYFTVIRSIGILIGKDVLAARFGIDKSSKDFDTFINKISNCKYTGILSSSYERWWFHKIAEFWNSISEGKSLRRSSALERVTLINNALGLELKPASPIELSTSATFWTICKETKLPIDPSEGFIVSRKNIEVWEEQEYISLYGVLEHPKNMALLSPINKQEVIELGKNASL